MINIIDNSIDACLEDDSGRDHRILLQVELNGNEALFTVSDNGVGMDSVTRDQIFELFFSSKGGKGTGFGLFISNNIIKRHNGSISVRSQKGHGTEFRMKIPRVYKSCS